MNNRIGQTSCCGKVISNDMITRHIVKSCCGSRSFIFETDKPIRKSQMDVFRNAGYSIPDNFYNAGLFYVQNGNFVASSSFGATKISIRCSGDNCSQLIDNFSLLLEQAVNIT